MAEVDRSFVVPPGVRGYAVIEQGPDEGGDAGIAGSHPVWRRSGRWTGQFDAFGNLQTQEGSLAFGFRKARRGACILDSLHLRAVFIAEVGSRLIERGAQDAFRALLHV